MCRVVDLSVQFPIDTKKAIEALGGEKTIFYSMLGKFETMSLLSTMEELRDAVNELDYSKIKNKAHSLKGASGYIGAAGIHYSCYHIQEQYLAENYDKMVQYYPTLIEQVIQFRLYSRQAIAEFHKKQPEIPEGIEKIAIADKYKVVSFEGQFYCLYNDITGKPPS